LTLAISQSALAQPETAGDHGPKNRGEYPCYTQMTPEMIKSREKFLTETTAERKALAQKNAEMRAIMKAGTPDTVKASQVAGELFELREKLRSKAQETGLPLPMLLTGHGYHGMVCPEGRMMKHHKK
jgi:zinc resistance-associated protein